MSVDAICKNHSKQGTDFLLGDRPAGQTKKIPPRARRKTTHQLRGQLLINCDCDPRVIHIDHVICTVAILILFDRHEIDDAEILENKTKEHRDEHKLSQPQEYDVKTSKNEGLAHITPHHHPINEDRLQRENTVTHRLPLSFSCQASTWNKVHLTLLACTSDLTL